MRLLIFGRFTPTSDPTLQAVVDAARAAGHVVVVADIHAFVTGPVRWSPHAGVLRLGDIVIAPDDVDVVLLGPLPSAFARTSAPGTTLSADEHDRRQKVQAARHALAWSIVCDLEARGVPVVSSPTLARPFDHKPLQLAALARAGIAIAETAIDDDDRPDDRWLTKPVIGGAVDFGGVVGAVAGVPRIVQRRREGAQMRIAVVGGEVVAAGVVDVVGDWRLVPGLRWRPADVDDHVRATAIAAATICHFDVCAIDMISPDHHAHAGEARSATRAEAALVLEANRTPQLMDLASDLGVDVAGAIVALCEARARR